LENPHKKKNWNQKCLSSMKYISFKKKHYYISTLDGDETYIIGYNLNKTENFLPSMIEIKNRNKYKNENITKTAKDIFNRDFMTYEKDIMHKGWSIVDSLISLRQNLTYSYSINEDSISNTKLIELEKTLSNDDRKKIIKWLKKYGMPFLGDKIESNEMYIGIPPFKYGFKNDFFTCYIKNACVCRLSSFLISLNIIFKTFAYYLFYTYDIEIAEKIEFKKIDYDTNDLDSYIRRAFSSISDKAIIDLDNILEKKELPRFEGCCDTLISLSMYQLAIITSSKKICSAAGCSCCEKIFIPTRRSRHYCMTCSRQKKYKKQHNAEESIVE